MALRSAHKKGLVLVTIVLGTSPFVWTTHFHKKYSRRDQINLNSWNKFPEPIPQIIQVPACELLVGESPRSQITIIQSLSGILVPITPFKLKYILNFMRRGLQDKFSIWSF